MYALILRYSWVGTKSELCNKVWSETASAPCPCLPCQLAIHSLWLTLPLLGFESRSRRWLGVVNPVLHLVFPAYFPELSAYQQVLALLLCAAARCLWACRNSFKHSCWWAFGCLPDFSVRNHVAMKTLCVKISCFTRCVSRSISWQWDAWVGGQHIGNFAVAASPVPQCWALSALPCASPTALPLPSKPWASVWKVAECTFNLDFSDEQDWVSF